MSWRQRREVAAPLLMRRLPEAAIRPMMRALLLAAAPQAAADGIGCSRRRTQEEGGLAHHLQQRGGGVKQLAVACACGAGRRQPASQLARVYGKGTATRLLHAKFSNF